MPPLVSCVMPTADRRAFVPQAIRAFLRQEYEPCELLILDDGADAIGDLIPDDERIRYVWTSAIRSASSATWRASWRRAI